MRRPVRHTIAIAAVLACLAGGGVANAAGGTIQLPCSDPTLTKFNITPPGVCGVKLTSVTPGTRFRVSPAKPADLDIYFYDSPAIGSNVWPYTGGIGNCGDLVGPANDPYIVPAGATFAIVVLSPGCANNANVAFTYSTL